MIDLDRLKVAVGNSRLLRAFVTKPLDVEEGDSVTVHLPNHLGDGVLAIPVVHSLLVRRDLRVRLVCLPQLLPLWEWARDRCAITVLPPLTRASFGAARAVLRAVRTRHALLLATGEEIAWLYLRAGFPNRVGYDFWGRGCLLNRALPSDGAFTSRRLVATSLVDNYLGLLDALGVERRMPPRPWLSLGRPRGPRGGPVSIAIARSSSSPERALPDRVVDHVISTLRARTSLRVHFVGTAETGGAARFSFPDVEIQDFEGRTSLAQLMGLLRGCDLFIGPDSGGAHLSAALGVPCVSVFTSGSPVWTRPAGGPSRVVVSHPPCAPCFGSFSCGRSFRCREEMDPAAIASAAIDLLETGGVPERGAPAP